MSVIAFDGVTVAADKQSTSQSGFIQTVTKLHRADDGAVLAVCGNTTDVLLLVAWYNAGCNPEKFPHMKNDDPSFLTVFRAGERVVEYEGSPGPIVWEDRLYATGSGKGPAMGAMMAGVNARRAVEIASVVMSCCGQGVDVMELSSDAVREGGTRPAAAGTAPAG